MASKNVQPSFSCTFVLLTALFLLQNTALAKEPADYVDPLIGTSTSRWMLYPGPSMPFGLVKLSPDNQNQSWKAGYEYIIENVAGFSHIHSWVMGGVLLMPTTGPLQTVPGDQNAPDEGYRSRIDKESETAEVGYYSVELTDYDIRAELTATTRTGIHRYTFPKGEAGRVLIDLKIPTEYGFNLDWGSVRQVNDHELEGFSIQHTYDHFSNLLNEYTVHFVIQFNRPYHSFGGWEGDKQFTKVSQVYGHGDLGCYVHFDGETDEPVIAKVGISLVSIDQARLNLEAETGPYGFDFDAIRAMNHQTWNELLSTIEIEGGTETDRTKFYTNFYRSYAARTILSDVNGKYVDMCEQVQQLEDPNSPVYGCDAFWNTFWNLNQLWALATPDVANQWVKSLLEVYDKGGWLPKGPTGFEYSSIMVASHEVALINSVYQKGIRDYDVEKAYQAMKHVQTTPAQAHPCGGLVGNRNLKGYMKHNYVPHGEQTHLHHFGMENEGPVSNTLEYCFDDWNVAQMAKALGKEEDYYYFRERAKNYQNVFDPSIGYMRPKYADGSWGPLDGVVAEKEESWGWSGTGFIEGNSWQYTWFVPHDVHGLVALMGKDEFNQRLEEGFVQSSETNFNAEGDLFYNYPINHGNQPNMQAAYLFNYSGMPWKTQHWAREIMDKYYGDGPIDGWPGDEDQGQMGAWFVMSAMGLFQMEGGGSVEPFYEIGSPLFEKVTLHLDHDYYPGGTFVIEAKNASQENRYVQSAMLDGEPLEKPWFYHRDLVDGGRLVLEMGPEPNPDWGSDPADAPPSMSQAGE